MKWFWSLVTAAWIAGPAWLAAQDILIESVVLTIAQQAEVPARESGVLAELLVQEGKTIQAGELIGRLDDAEPTLVCQRAALDLERARKAAANDVKVRLAKKELEIAQAELRRADEAVGRYVKSVTAAEHDRLRLDVQRALLQVEQAEFEQETARLAMRVCENDLQAAQEKLQRRRVCAPVSGTIVLLSKRPGEWLQAGETVARVIGLERIRAEGFVPAEQLEKIRVGGKVRLAVELRPLDAAPYAGTITFVSPEVDPVSGQARIWAEIDNRQGRLRPGLSGSLRIEP